MMTQQYMTQTCVWDAVQTCVWDAVQTYVWDANQTYSEAKSNRRDILDTFLTSLMTS